MVPGLPGPGPTIAQQAGRGRVNLRGGVRSPFPASLRDLWRGLRIFYRWLGSRYPGQAVNPIEETTAYGQRILHVYPPSVPPTIPRTLTYQQLHKLLTLGCVCRQDRAFVLLILDTGIRLNAWCEL